MKELEYIPYEELSMAWKSDSVCEFTTPWIRVEYHVHSTYQSNFEELRIYLQRKSKTSVTKNIQTILKRFSVFPFTYISPRRNLSHKITSRQNVAGLGMNDKSERGGGFSERSTLRQARVPSFWSNRYDPLTLLTLLRRERFVALCKFPVFKEFYAGLERLRHTHRDQFIKVMQIAVAQNHFVTTACQKLIAKLDTLERVSSPIKNFFYSEKNHDQLTLQSLKHLGIDQPSFIPIFKEVEELMKALEVSLEAHPLILASGVDAFESNGYFKGNKLADLMGGISETKKSSEPLNVHHQINQEGNHQRVAETFLEPSLYVDKTQALEAIRFAEYLTDLQIKFGKRLLETLAT